MPGRGDEQAAGLNRGRPRASRPARARTLAGPQPEGRRVQPPSPIRIRSEFNPSLFRAHSESHPGPYFRLAETPPHARTQTASPPRCKGGGPAFPRTSASLARGASSPRPAARMRRGSGTLHSSSAYRFPAGWVITAAATSRMRPVAGEPAGRDGGCPPDSAPLPPPRARRRGCRRERLLPLPQARLGMNVGGAPGASHRCPARRLCRKAARREREVYEEAD